MAKILWRTMKIYRYYVRPKKGEAVAFPFDMMRYDRCWPATTKAASLLQNIIEIMASCDLITNVQIELKSNDPFTAGRWESYGWTPVLLEIVNSRSGKVYKA